MSDSKQQEIVQAWKNWFHFWSETEYDLTGYSQFERFIGQRLLDSAIPLTPEAAHRLRLLLSPHHHAILKAYKAKHFPQEVP